MVFSMRLIETSAFSPWFSSSMVFLLILNAGILVESEGNPIRMHTSSSDKDKVVRFSGFMMGFDEVAKRF